MGWTSYDAGIHDAYYENGRWIEKVNRNRIKEICDKMVTWTNDSGSRKPIKSALVGNTYYAAVEHIQPDGSRRVWCAVTLFKTHKSGPYYGDFSYKDMDESCGPCEHKCPIGILKLLTETESESAKEWRDWCWKYHAEQKEKKNKPSLGSLPLGTVIEFEIKGKGVFRAKKANDWKHKRPIWTDGYWRFPTTVIPNDWKVIENV